MADRSGRLVWTIAPKHHVLLHLAQRAMYLNPSRGNTFMDESYMSIIKTVVQASVDSNPPHAVPCAVMEKYRWAFHFGTVYDELFFVPPSA